MIDIFKAVILGIIEGITEFLPISSTGHLILANQWISFSEEFTLIFDIFIQLGAIFAVILYFRKEVFPPKISQVTERNYLNFWLKVVIAFLPAAIFGYLLADTIEEHLFSPEVVAGSLFLGGIVLVLIERRKHPIRFETVSEMPFKVALFIGMFQCLAMVPGTSRSAATIIGALVLGASRKLAAEFSFFLAIPTIVAASVYSLLKGGVHLSGDDLLILSVGFLISFFVALGVIKFLMDYIRKHSFILFGYYRIVLAIFVLLWLIWGKP